MFTRLARIFHLASGTNDENESSSEEDFDGTCVDMGSAYVRPSRKTQEIEGVVTNMYSTYGLINGEIVFTRENFAGSGLPLVGDKVNVTAYKEHSSAGWLAERVSKVANCWDDSSAEWTSDEEAKDIKNVDCKDAEEEVMKKKRKERIIADRQALEQLLKEKFGIEIVGTDFGNMEVGEKKFVSFEIKNNGTECQSLCSYNMSNKSHQIDFGPLKMFGIDTKSESKKYLEMFPIDIMPGQSVSIAVICLAKYIGKETQTIIFYFEKFKLGKVVSVSVSDPSLKFEGIFPDSTYQKIDKLERVLMTRQQAMNRDIVLVPGPKLQFNKGKQKPKGAIVRLAHYHVPDDLRDCVLNGKDVTRILPCLKWQLNSSNYEIRFSGLLHLEEIQQEIDIREFDMDKARMERAGDYLSLQVPGLLEGRPSLMLGDRVIASEVELLNTAAPAYEGVVHQVRNDSVYLMFSPEFHKTFDPETQYNMTFTFNRSTLRRCHMAVELASKFKDEILFPAKIVLKPSQVDLLNCSSASTSSSTNHRAEVVPVTSSIGRKHSSYYPNIQTDQSVKFFNNQLNTRQRLAVIRILQGHARPTPYIIFGPPGTGKTITVVESILQVQHHLAHARILACTPSNSAADLLAERLFQSGVVHKSMMVRLYAAFRQDVSIPDSIKSFSSFVDDVDLNLEDKCIVICTCATAGCLYRVGKKFVGKSSRNKTSDVGRCGNKSGGVGDAGVCFTHVFVDEAGQATEPESMIAVGLVMATHGQIVLAGDPQQLGPVLRSQLSKDYGLNVSYMERLAALPLYERNENKFSNRGGYDPLLITKLLDNYRSHPSLMYLSSHMFYHGELVMKADKQLMTCLCNWSMLPNKNNFPILFHGVRGEDLREGNSPSWFNPHEVVLTVKYLSSLLNNDTYTISPDDVGIITPYKKQVEKIRQTAIRHDLPKVKVGSVEEFQGQERLAIIISTVRSSESLLDLDLKYTLGFLGNQKRFNVAITRAHSLLVVIGNPHVLCQDLSWSRLIRYCVNNNAYLGCDLPQFSHDDDPFFTKPDAPHAVPHLLSPDVSVADVVADVAARRSDQDVVDVVVDGRSAGKDQVVVDGNQLLREAANNVKLEDSFELFCDMKIIQEIIGDEEMDDEESSAPYKNTCIKNSVYDNVVDDFKENSTAVTKPKTLLHSSPFVFSDPAADLVAKDDNNKKVGGDDGGNVMPPDDATSASFENIEAMRTFTTSGSTISELSNVSVQDLLNKGMIDSSNDSMELNEELCRKIQKQMDYYFSDVNLKKDDFLQKQIALYPDGWVNLSVLLTFNRMKTFNVNSKFVANALKRYSTIIEVDVDGEMVRRHPRHIIEPDAEKWKQLLFHRSIVLLNYPHSEKVDDMQTYFENFGPITHIERGIPVKFFTGLKKRYSLKKADLIIFDCNESPRNLFKRSLTQFKSMGLKVYYLDDTVKGCVDYFESCRVNKQSRQSIEYVVVDQVLTSETRLQNYVRAQNHASSSKQMNAYSPHHKRYQQGYCHSSKTFNNHRFRLGQQSLDSRNSEFEAQFPREHIRGNDQSRFVGGVECSSSQRTSSLMAYSPGELNEAVQNISAMNISSINVSAGRTPTNYFPSSSDDFVGVSVMNVGEASDVVTDCGNDGDDEEEANELFLSSSCDGRGIKSFDDHVDEILNDKRADSNEDGEDENDDDVILISETCVDEDDDSDNGNHDDDDVVNKDVVDDKDDDDQPVDEGEYFNDVHFENWT